MVRGPAKRARARAVKKAFQSTTPWPRGHGVVVTIAGAEESDAHEAGDAENLTTIRILPADHLSRDDGDFEADATDGFDGAHEVRVGLVGRDVAARYDGEIGSVEAQIAQ